MAPPFVVNYLLGCILRVTTLPSQVNTNERNIYVSYMKDVFVETVHGITYTDCSVFSGDLR